MREIKFRGKAKHNNNWYFGYLNYSQSRKEYYILEDFASFPAPIFENTIGQYTGLKDTEEVKIYEGDIVKWCGSFKETDGTIKNCESIYTIKWVDGAFYQVDEFYTPEYEILSDVISVLDDDETYEVIGNIYDNPELLEREINNE